MFYILGHSDDTIKISGKRMGPAQIEGLLTPTGKVSEAAAVGVADPVKGSAIVCGCDPIPGIEGNAVLEIELTQAAVERMGASYRPRRILFLNDLPRTRKMKVMRRVLRALLEGSDLGDLSSLSNPSQWPRCGTRSSTLHSLNDATLTQ
ncbi:AMP-binding enzyme [Bradyrhizobium altum]|uniref:AMP-binding enzyme n=1 Tax=Bradyrhizobium altum TaxID=1571202 RepID=UPI001E618427|nr:hypothetical protein [Bradyrhizobium altum]